MTGRCETFALQDEIVRRIVTTLNLQLALVQQGLLVPRLTRDENSGIIALIWAIWRST